MACVSAITANDQARPSMRRNKSDGAAAIAQAIRIGQVSLQIGRSHITGIGWVSTQMHGRTATNRYTIPRPFRIRCRRLCTKIASCVSAGVPINHQNIICRKPESQPHRVTFPTFESRRYSHDANRFTYQAGLSFVDRESKDARPPLVTCRITFPFCFRTAIRSAQFVPACFNP